MAKFNINWGSNREVVINISDDALTDKGTPKMTLTVPEFTKGMLTFEGMTDAARLLWSSVSSFRDTSGTSGSGASDNGKLVVGEIYVAVLASKADVGFFKALMDGKPIKGETLISYYNVENKGILTRKYILAECKISGMMTDDGVTILGLTPSSLTLDVKGFGADGVEKGQDAAGYNIVEAKSI